MRKPLHGVAAREFARRELGQLLVNPLRWEVLWWRPEPFELWLETFPQSGLHGGGPSDLQPIDMSALDALTSHAGWECPEAGPLVGFLVHRTLGRAPLRPLRDLLNARLANDPDDPTEFRGALGGAILAAPGVLRPSERALLGRLMLGCAEGSERPRTEPPTRPYPDDTAPQGEVGSRPLRPLPIEELRRRYPVCDLLPGWCFRVAETSAGVYLLEGADRLGRTVSRRGTDAGALLAACLEDAAH